MTSVVIGCPIYKRDWILPYWFACISQQNLDFSKIGFVFIASSKDEKTIKNLISFRNSRPDIKVFEIEFVDDIVHFEHEKNSRQWSMSKYYNMVHLRNCLLKKVREIQPDYFFSLDSDILLTNPNTINFLISHIQDGADGVSPLMFMTPNDIMYPSVMNWTDEPGGQAFRQENYPIGSYFKSDIIMAAKMMSKTTYQAIDYEMHPQGEDLGWCANAAKSGLQLYCASYIYAPHIMHEQMLDHFIKMGDTRHFASLQKNQEV